MALFRSKAEDKVRKAGYDPARLPPAGGVPDVALAPGTLGVSGGVEEPLSPTYEQLREPPATDVTTDIHCVTRWSRFDAQFKGVHWSELAKLCKPKPSARFAIA